MPPPLSDLSIFCVLKKQDGGGSSVSLPFPVRQKVFGGIDPESRVISVTDSVGQLCEAGCAALMLYSPLIIAVIGLVL
ncbi:hypothetical protein JTE90_026612 [Oedothorax gibbosus]|uniref:Uncharacterized protein n=1 Tax=Oedothorax gibbosus TaxID=931172 RepID=A0AAV6V0R7_9ARAC|nr:hypothetical protein JTE90_026612 [Oedothorax gibbosus]